MTLLAKSTIRPEDARNPIRHLGLERSFPPSIGVQTAASEFANSVVLWRHPVRRLWFSDQARGLTEAPRRNQPVVFMSSRLRTGFDIFSVNLGV